MMQAPEGDIEGRYRDIFEHTPLGLWEEDYTELITTIEAMKAAGIHDLDAHLRARPERLVELAQMVKVLDVNRACLDVFGARTKAELLGSVGKVFGEEALAVFREQVLVLARGGREFSADALVRTLDGRPLYVFLTLTVFPPQDGFIRALVSTLDISRWRHVEDALRASEERYAELYDNAPDMFASLEPETGIIAQCNETMAASLGYATGELVGQPILALVHPSSAETAASTLGRLPRADMVECRHIRLQGKSGVVIDTSLKISVVRDEGGRVLWHSAVWRDIGEQVRAEAALVSNETIYRTLTESIPHMIWLGDAKGTISYCNQALCDAMGLTREQICGRNWCDTIHADDCRRLCPVKEAAYARGIAYRGESRLRGADGTYRSVYFVITPIKDEHGAIRHWVGVNTDLSELKRTQEELRLALERSNTELAEIAYAASHDLQEPLRMVTSYVQLLAQRYAGKLDQKADKYIDYAVQGAKRIRRLIRDVLTLSEINMEGKVPTPTDCAAVLARAERGLHHEIAASGAAVVCETPLPQVMGDAAQMVLLFRCLLSNSIKFRREAPLRIAISARPEGSMWLFTVQDNGIGFEDGYGERIFQMFQRLHPRGMYPGTGIGLTLARRIVERHGGRIWARGMPAEGATVSFTLPAADAELAEDV